MAHYAHLCSQPTKLLHALLIQPRLASHVRTLAFHQPNADQYLQQGWEAYWNDAALYHKASIAPLLLCMPLLEHVQLPLLVKPCATAVLEALSGLQHLVSLSLINPHRDEYGLIPPDRSLAHDVTYAELQQYFGRSGLQALSLTGFPGSVAFEVKAGETFFGSTITSLSLIQLKNFDISDFNKLVCNPPTRMPLQSLTIASCKSMVSSQLIPAIQTFAPTLRYLMLTKLFLSEEYEACFDSGDQEKACYLQKLPKLEGVVLQGPVLGGQTLMRLPTMLKRILLRDPPNSLDPTWLAASLMRSKETKLQKVLVVNAAWRHAAEPLSVRSDSPAHHTGPHACVQLIASRVPATITIVANAPVKDDGAFMRGE